MVSADRGAARPARGEIALIAQAQQEYYWEFLAAQPASGLTGYSYVAETTSDSTAGGNPYTAFMVQARHTGTIANWGSAPDSGYSVDNLSPAPPAAFSAQFFTGPPPSPAFKLASSGYIWFHWSASGEDDFLEYRLHRGASPGFAPGPGNLVVAQPDTGFILTNLTPDHHYKLLAVDVNGNASATAVLSPTEIVGVEDTTLPTAVRLAPPWPNPLTDHGMVSFDLPRRAQVAVELFDAKGRRVRELAAGTWPAGRHVLEWDRCGEDGRPVASGVYWLRLDADGRRLTARMAVIR